jgi:putative protein-disulfide isomerase
LAISCVGIQKSIGVTNLGKLIGRFVVVTTAICFTNKKNTMKDIKITYYYDALCGWCYGFSPVFNQIYAEYQSKITFDVVSGGLFLGNRVGPINEVAPYIKAGAYKTVESTTGVKFGKGFIENGLEQGKMMLNSLYPAIALCIVKADYPEHTVAFAGLLHQAFYVDGMDPVKVDGYAAYAASLGIDTAEFNEKMKNPVYEQHALAEFSFAGQQGLGGYPALVLEVDGKREVLSSGYVSYAVLKGKVDFVLGR